MLYSVVKSKRCWYSRGVFVQCRGGRGLTHDTVPKADRFGISEPPANHLLAVPLPRLELPNDVQRRRNRDSADNQ
jgi:hypothetical protein